MNSIGIVFCRSTLFYFIFSSLLQVPVVGFRMLRVRLQPFRTVRALNKAVPFSSGKEKKIKGSAGKYSSTVFLPSTSFDIRANASKTEIALLQWWKDNGVYESLMSSNTGSDYVIHDGPPYANGDLHIGHSLNKILKDFINRYKILRGHKVKFVPGWDCHGLPIEMKVLQQIKGKVNETLDAISLRAKASEFARETITKQRSSFERYGVWGSWDEHYSTMQNSYEAAQIRVFGKLFEKGIIYRGRKPVYWSPSSRTALAEAELEYSDAHVSRSIYVGFSLESLSTNLSKALGTYHVKPSSIKALIWTTTPWSIPANLAIAVNADMDYAVLSHPNILGGDFCIAAVALIDSMCTKFGITEASKPLLRIIATTKGKDLVGSKYRHVLYSDRVCPVIEGGDYITTDSGTGLVHTAPGHGVDDYHVGLKHGLELLAPIDDKGRFTAEAGQDLEGLEVLSTGTEAVISTLRSSGALVKEESYVHRYPYDWRTKKPVILRATQQWFASVSSFQPETISAIKSVEWVPATGMNRILSMTESRGDWCISRQRVWGVPIPVFYHKETREPLINTDIINHVARVFENHPSGSDAWWTLSVKDLLPPPGTVFGIPVDAAEAYDKGSDTMDVWFDSGSSWAGVLQDKKRNLQFPADMYLEGSDQHRGWFQSSLLTSVAAEGVAPYKTVLTHGFVMDEKGYKMSKSLGNVVDPDVIINGGKNVQLHPAYGADVLRLWVSGVDYTNDVCLGNNIIKQVSESYRKIRNTLRFLLGNLKDFDPLVHCVPYKNMPSVDKYMLGKLSALVAQSEQSFESYQFFKISSSLSQFAAVDLSAFYLDICKDRLYISARDDLRRRSAQTVMYYILDQLVTITAPILPFLSEEVWQNVPYARGENIKSVFQKGWIGTGEAAQFPSHEEKRWNQIRMLRRDVNKCIELARSANAIGASLDCGVVVYMNDSNAELWQDIFSTMLQSRSFLGAVTSSSSVNTVDDLRYILMVSELELVNTAQLVKDKCAQYQLSGVQTESGLVIGVHVAAGRRCERCWYHTTLVSPVEGLCPRCASVIEQQSAQQL